MSTLKLASSDGFNQLFAQLGLFNEQSHQTGPKVGISLVLETTDKDIENARQIDDESQVRILEKTRRWLGSLQRQAKRLSSNASELYERCVGSNVFDGSVGYDFKIVEQLEWTLAGFEHSIEDLRPTADQPESLLKFHIRWAGDDGTCFWSERDLESVSLLALLRDAAEVDGQFEPILAGSIAQQVARDLRSDALQLMWFRPVDRESDEAVFEFIRRGTEVEPEEQAIDFTEDPGFEYEDGLILSIEIESQLGTLERAAVARFVDDGVCELVRQHVSLALAGQPAMAPIWMYEAPEPGVPPRSSAGVVLNAKGQPQVGQYIQSRRMPRGLRSRYRRSVQAGTGETFGGDRYDTVKKLVGRGAIELNQSKKAVAGFLHSAVLNKLEIACKTEDPEHMDAYFGVLRGLEPFMTHEESRL